jgi:hypothetical protein
LHEQLRKTPFVTTLHIDLDTGSFCYDACDHVFTLTHWGKREIYYTFDAQHGGFRESEFMPPELALYDHFTLDLRSTRFRRNYNYETCSACTAGMRHIRTYFGKCQKVPFTGLSRRSDTNDR